jgi:hypothetical protein
VSFFPTDVLTWLAFLEMLSQSKGGAPSPAPGPSPIPASVVIPPPGVIPVAPPVPPGGLPVMPAWNQGITPCPATLPPFPGPGWVPDNPVCAAIATRATYWNALLWNFAAQTITHPSVCEQVGGRWITFVAAWHPGDSGPQTFMSTEAWRLATDAPCAAPVAPIPVHVVPPPAPAPIPVHVIPPPGVIPIAPPAPTPVPAPIPAPVAPVVVQTPLQAAAVAMSNALTRNGYRLADQAIYKQFQSLARISADGFPGTGTMGQLRTVLSSMGLPMPPVPVYPWKAGPGYDGVNAPTSAQWYGRAAPAPAPAPGPVAPMGPPGPVQPYPGTGAWQTNAPYIARYQTALMFLGYPVGPTGADGKYGPNTAAAVKAFQAAAGLTQDGEAGAATAAALDSAVATHGAS